MAWSLKRLKESLAEHRRRYGIERGRLASRRERAREGSGVVTHKEADWINEAKDAVKDELRLINRRKSQIRSRRGREPRHTTRLSPNRSSRFGTKPRVIVLHSTEGGYAGSVSWLCNPRAQASAHVVVSKAGESTRLVPDAEKAWHVAHDNPYTLGIEQEGFASQTSWPEAQLRETAAWIAYWSRKYDIPITHSTTRGVCRHSDLGAAGGGHHDPGKSYPLARVLAMARG